MAKTVTCHDAILVFKYYSFLAELREYEINLKMYPAPIPTIPGRYYVVIQDDETYFDSAWVINLHKKLIVKTDLKKVLNEIEDNKKPGKIPLVEYERTLKEKMAEDLN